MVLKSLEVLKPLHGCEIARRIEQISQDLLGSEPGHSLFGVAQAGAGRRGCIGTAPRRITGGTRFYRLTRAGWKLPKPKRAAGNKL